MFGIGPTEFAFFLVILLLAVGPEKLPTFMRTVGKGMRQVRSASREFKDAIGLDELMREGDVFRAPPVRPPRARPTPVESKSEAGEAESDPQPKASTPPPVPRASEAAQALQKTAPPKPAGEAEAEAPADPDAPAEANHP